MPKYLFTADFHLDNSPGLDGTDEQGVSRLLRRKIKVLDSIRMTVLSQRIPLIIGGDITELKDRVPGVVLNLFFQWLESFERKVPIYILLGNHDFVLRDFPSIWPASLLGSIEVISGARKIHSGGMEVWAIAFQKDLGQLDHFLAEIPGTSILFMHQPLIGAVLPNEHRIEHGASLTRFNRFPFVFSGDIHLPQKIGNVVYVGSPYQNNFGEQGLNPRIIIVDSDTQSFESYDTCPDFEFGTVNLTKAVPDCLALNPGTYLKLRVKCTPEEWQQYDQDKERSNFLRLGAAGVMFEWEPIRQQRVSKVSEHGSMDDSVYQYVESLTDEELGGFSREELVVSGKEFCHEL